MKDARLNSDDNSIKEIFFHFAYVGTFYFITLMSVKNYKATVTNYSYSERGQITKHFM